MPFGSSYLEYLTCFTGEWKAYRDDLVPMLDFHQFLCVSNALMGRNSTIFTQRSFGLCVVNVCDQLLARNELTQFWQVVYRPDLCVAGLKLTNFGSMVLH